MKSILENIKTNTKLIIVVFVLGVVVGFLINKSTHQQISTSNDESTHQHISKSDNQTWTCSMHPQIKQNKPGLCPICAMDLVPMATMATESEHVDLNEIQMTESALALASIQTTIVKQGIPEKNVQLLGKVQADERNISQLTARFGGRIEKLFINYTELETATKDAYDNLPACCQYTRAKETAVQPNIEHEKFKVSGNCGMCEETIETAAKKLNGVNDADWSQDTKLIHVSFNSDKVKLTEIHKVIAKAGYDTELEKADDEVYNSLHGCCQYTR